MAENERKLLHQSGRMKRRMAEPTTEQLASFEGQMEIARLIMDEDREMLAKLAKL